MKKNTILVGLGAVSAAAAILASATSERWLPTPKIPAGEIQASMETQAPAPDAGQPVETHAEKGRPETKTQQAAVSQPKAGTATPPDKPKPAGTQQAATEPPAAVAPAKESKLTAAQPAAPSAVAEEKPGEVREATAGAEPEEKTTAKASPGGDVAAPAEMPTDTAAAAAPSFDTVRIEKTGEAVIAGRADPGAEVSVKLNGETIGTTTANPDGAFVLTPDRPLPAGSGALTVESKRKNETVARKSEQAVAVIVPAGEKQDALVAVVSPKEPTRVLQKPPAATPAAEAKSDSPGTGAAAPVSLDAVDYDETGNIVFSGRGQPGGTTRLYVDNGFLGDARAGGDGRWSFSSGAPIAPGVHALRVDGVDPTGAVASRIEVPFFREATTKVATAAPPPPAPDTKAKEGRVVIQPGNNLWRLSTVIYGSGVKYTVIYEANRDRIRNPHWIYPGQVFRTPDVVPPESIDPDRRDPLAPAELGGQ
jgi:nucleoid-associated protein YgaU